MSASLGKFDPALETNLPDIKREFEELSLFLHEYAVQKSHWLHSMLEKKHPTTFAALHYQHEQSEIDWRAIEDEARRFFAGPTKPDRGEWHRFYLRFNQFMTLCLAQLQYEELVVLPLMRELTTEADLVLRTRQMFSHLSQEAAALSKKWSFLACNLSELKEMGYVP